jgi:hypothetical protein
MTFAQMGSHPLFGMPFYPRKAFAAVAVVKVTNPSSQGFIDSFHHHWQRQPNITPMG